MFKPIIFAVVASASLVGAAAIPAQAANSPADCAYYQKLLNEGAGYTSPNSNYNWYSQKLTECRAGG